MYLVLGHRSVHDAAAAWTPVWRQLGAVESVVVARSSGDGGVGGLPVAGSTRFRSG